MPLEEIEKEDRKLFFDWFTGLLNACDTCLKRDVLRNQKENLWEEWKKVEPYWFKPIEAPPRAEEKEQGK